MSPKPQPERSGGTLASRDLASRDLVIAGLIGAAVLALYVATLCPTIYAEDSAEFATAAAVFGVPHPPGYPLYTLLAGLFVRLIPIGDIGFRANLFSAVCGAATAVTLWFLLRRLNVTRAAAGAATVCFAAGRTFWSQSLVAEVHSLNGWLLALTILCAFEAFRNPSRTRFALAGLTIGLAIGHRNLTLIFVAPVLFFLIQASRGAEKRRPLLVASFLALAASGVVYAYLPLAARRDPALAMGAPVTLDRFWDVISTRTYFRHVGATSLATVASRCWAFLGGLPANLGFALLAIPSGILAWRRKHEGARLVTITWMAAGCFLFAVFYNVLDVDSYLIPASLALAVAAGVGIDSWGRGWPKLFAVASLAAVPLSFSANNLHGMTLVRDFGRQLVDSSPPRALILSFSDTETHALTYEQAVEHRRADVVVVSANEIAPWYIDQLARRHPDVAWPPAGPLYQWLPALVKDVRASRPFCLTKPVTMGVRDVRLVPTGLLFCLAAQSAPRDLATSASFWPAAVTPSQSDLDNPDVHIQSINFDFALSRFSWAAALAEGGKMDEARAQLAAVVAADPDRSERTIVEAMKLVGREGHRDIGLGRRAEQALQMDPRDPAFLALLRL